MYSGLVESDIQTVFLAEEDPAVVVSGDERSIIASKAQTLVAMIARPPLTSLV